MSSRLEPQYDHVILVSGYLVLSIDHKMDAQYQRCTLFKNWFMLSVRIRVMDARGKFGEHERSVRVARGAAESNSSVLSALQTSQVHP